MSGTQTPTSTSMLNYAIQGYNGINLTNWTTSAASVIAGGSGVEVAGAFFRYSSDDTNDATSFSAITTNATAYLQLVPSGTVGSQIVTSSWTSTAPTWRVDLNGFYASAASATRYVAGCVKTGTTSYELKFIITPRSNLRHEQAESFASGITVTGASVLGGNVTITGNTTISGTATVAGAIISGADITATTATISGAVTAGSRVGHNYSLDNTQFGSVYSAMSPYMPTTSATYIITGSIKTAGGSVHIMSYASRTSATAISILGVNISTGVITQIFAQQSDTTTAATVILTW